MELEDENEDEEGIHRKSFRRRKIVLRILPSDFAGTCGAKPLRHMNSLLAPLGWLGFCLCFVCWFPQTAETIRARSCHVNVRFLILNLSGCLALFAYSLARGEWPFVVLNGVCAGAGGINLWYARRAPRTGSISIARRYSGRGARLLSPLLVLMRRE